MDRRPRSTRPAAPPLTAIADPLLAAASYDEALAAASGAASYEEALAAITAALAATDTAALEDAVARGSLLARAVALSADADETAALSAEADETVAAMSEGTRAKLSDVARGRSREKGRFADEPDKESKRDSARRAHTRQWVEDTLKQGAIPADALEVGVATPRVIHEIEKTGPKVRSAKVAFEHGHTRHMFAGHGVETEKDRGQVPITPDDVHDAARLLAAAHQIGPATDRRMHASSPPRFEAISEVAGYRHNLLIEIQRKGIVVRDMWKSKL